MTQQQRPSLVLSSSCVDDCTHSPHNAPVTAPDSPAAAPGSPPSSHMPPLALLHRDETANLQPQSAQRAADLAAAEAITESDSAQPASPKPALPSQHPPFSKAKTLKTTAREKRDAPTTTFQPATHIELPPPTYHIARTNTKNLPIYTDYKRGGNLHLTTIRKITGDLSALRDELRVFLNKKNEDVRINALTGHVIVKGHCTGQVKQFLLARGM
ncbi:Img2-domain-containing protein [Dothidotthia symphoricarpi CBS 119687]|uniref:Large ribosomal subunit protein mL49 n=1 Tax=Dothidotthia symphoricarpi CBS 119687 TaxID=1392245 RepID=A0A6A6ADM7_9PLEO|nr:Img2-domain-containing protein [Dothidotthia symphoricarpi CBS 119687]KAF2129880.1 Img2-domain-containing protein [Dothidotthia symphoricarpi CBS 119687]